MDILERAEALLDMGCGSEDAAFSLGTYQPTEEIQTHYGEARALFEEVLAKDPNNERALAGRTICDEMLTPQYPVQHLGPPPPDVASVSFVGTAPPKPLPTESELPWQRRRSMRTTQQAGLAYTRDAFERARQDLDVKVNDLIELAAGQEAPPGTVFAETRAALVALQEATHRQWKGHGPDFLDAALEALKVRLRGR